MAKTILGVDIGFDNTKLALCRNGKVKKVLSIPMPAGMVREGRITSPQAMGELLRSSLRKNHIHASRGAVVLPNELCYLRAVTMPVMTTDQLLYNIPYEFNDYIEDELKNYIFDYAMLTDFRAGAKTKKKEKKRRGRKAEEPAAESAYDLIAPPAVPAPGPAGAGPEEASATMELIAAAVPKAVMEDAALALGRAGIKMVKAAPAEWTYVSLIRALQGAENQDYCVLDIGYRAVRMYMYRGDRHMVTRLLESGMRNVDEAIADALSVDVHLAHSFLMSNYNDCQSKDFCVNAYNNIAVELMRALNFYRFSNPDNSLSDVWLCGGGAAVEPLCNVIKETLNMDVHRAQELVPGTREIENCQNYTQAIGITMD